MSFRPQTSPLHTQPSSEGDKRALSAELARLVESNNVDAVRAYFERGLKGEDFAHPGWDQLRIALEKENREMMKLLVTWGARPVDAEIEHLQNNLPAEKANHYLLLLELAGLYVPSLLRQGFTKAAEAPLQETSASSQSAPATPPRDILGEIHSLDIPDQWLTFLRAVQVNIGKNAIIAGGALRDLHLGKPVHDVDIFVYDTHWTHKPQERLEKALVYSKLSSNGSLIYRDHYQLQDIPIIKTNSHYPYNTLPDFVLCLDESRSLVFNVIFLNEQVGKALQKGRRKGGARWEEAQKEFLEVFTFGLSQIACDGKSLVCTDNYITDVTEKKIRLRNKQGDIKYIQKILKKYDDWETCDKTKEVMGAVKMVMTARGLS